MLRYKLRTLLLVLALGPPMLAGLYLAWASGRVHWRDWSIVIDQEPRAAAFEWPHSGVTLNED